MVASCSLGDGRSLSPIFAELVCIFIGMCIRGMWSAEGIIVPFPTFKYVGVFMFGIRGGAESSILVSI